MALTWLRWLALTLALLIAQRELAAETIGIVMDPASPAKQTRAQIESWATSRGDRVVGTPLPKDATQTLINCMLVDDRRCAAGVAGARGKADNIIYVVVDAESTSLYWFRKKRASAADKLSCTTCDPVLISATLERLSEASTHATGLVKIRSNPLGMTVLVDGVAVGETPLDRDVEIGEHELRLEAGGVPRKINLEAGQEVEIMLRVDAPDAPRRPRWPLVMIGAGAALLGTGVILIATSESPTGERPTYRNTVPGGVTLAIGGGLVAAAGTYFYLTKRTSGPTVTPADGGGAAVGWMGKF